MGKNRISEFLESIDSTKWNCVYQANGMTLLTAKEYNYRYEEIDNLRKQCKKQKEIIDKSIKNIENFLCTEDYINVNGIAIADNYKELLEILKGDSNE